MNILRNAYFYQAIFGVLFLAAIFLGGPMVSAFMPLLAVVALAYVLWRLVATHRRLAHAVPSRSAVVERKPVKWPNITGKVDEVKEATVIDPEAMRLYLDSQVIGQSVVSEMVARGIYRRMAQERRGKPVFTAMLSGPTGTGKTEMAKAISSYLHGDSNTMFRIDCANVIGEAGLQTFIGSPRGFAGSGSWGALTSHLRSTPRTVILFDEIEKAVTTPTSPMAKLLLSLLDEGICTEQSDGTKVSATEAVIILTSNAAQERLGQIFHQFKDQPDQLIRATKDALRDYFAPEFLARIDLVTTFSPLDNEARSRIIALHTALIAKSYGIEVESVDASFINEVLRLWTTLDGYGTREVIRWIEEAIAETLIGAKNDGLVSVRVSFEDGQARLDAA